MNLRVLLVVASLAGCADPDPQPAPQVTEPWFVAVTYGGGQFVVLRHYPDANSGFGQLAVETSTDGESWREVTRVVEHGAVTGGVAFAAGRFVAVASELVVAPTERRAVALTSPDGVTWTRAAMPPTDIASIAALDGSFVAASDSGLLTTTDGAAWTPVPDTSDRWWAPRVQRVGDRIFAFGEGPAVFETTDGATWGAADTTLTIVDSIGSIGGRVVGFGTYDCCFGEEPDGIQHVVLERAGSGWQLSETPLEDVHGLVDVGPHTTAAIGSTLATTRDGTMFEAHSTGVEIWRPTFATDGAGTVVMAGIDGMVSHDNGETWRRLPRH